MMGRHSVSLFIIHQRSDFILHYSLTDSRDACPYNTTFAEQTFHDTEGVISRNASRFISSIRLANAFQDGFAVVSFPYWLVEN